MQNLERWLREAKEKELSVAQMTNGMREYLQILILKAIYQSRYKRALSFMGGTCLRICYNLKRYSEDLDFTLDDKKGGYSFQAVNQTALRFLNQHGFKADMHVRDDKIVNKSFIRIRDVFALLGSHFSQDQKLHIKLEIDTRPIPVTKRQIETHFVIKFDENFPILKHTNETLFAGKVLAILLRNYTKGRDYYDLIWYLKNKINLDLSYLNLGLKQAGESLRLTDTAEVMDHLRRRVEIVSVKDILADVTPFLEDPSEKDWLKQYPLVFNQVATRYPG